VSSRVSCRRPALLWLRCVEIVLPFGVGGCLRCAGCYFGPLPLFVPKGLALRRLLFWTPALVCTKRTDSFCTGWYSMWLDRQAELLPL